MRYGLVQLSKETPLFTLATTGDAENTKLLCQAGANINFQLEDDRSVGSALSARMGWGAGRGG